MGSFQYLIVGKGYQGIEGSFVDITTGKLVWKYKGMCSNECREVIDDRWI